jgi:hypothetical protein
MILETLFNWPAFFVTRAPNFTYPSSDLRGDSRLRELEMYAEVEAGLKAARC